MEKKSQKARFQYGLAVRLCVALLGIGVGLTLLWSEQWSGNAIWLPITQITVSALALGLFLRAIKKKEQKNDDDKYEL